MRYHIRTRIAVAVSLLTLGLLTFVTWLGLTFFERQIKKSTYDHLTSTLQLATRGLEWRLLQAQLLLEHLGNDLPRTIIDRPQALQQYLNEHSSASLVFDNVMVFFDRDGHALASEPKYDEVVGVDFSYREYFKVTAATKYRYISRPFLSAQKHGHPILMFTEPLLDADGELLGMLGGSVDLYHENFLGRLVNNQLGEHGYFILLDNYDTLVMHPDASRILDSWREIIPDVMSLDLWTKSRGRIEHMRLDEQELLGVFQHLTPGDWTLVALLPRGEVFAPIRQARMLAVVTLLALSLLSIWLIRRLTFRLTEPLVALASQVRKHVDDTETFAPPEDNEFEELGELADSIRELIKDVVKRRRVLQNQLTFLENLVETIPSPIFYKDSGFRYIGCNRAFLDYIGFSREQIIGRTAADLFDEEKAFIYQQADLDLWESGEDQVYEATVRYADGCDRDVIFHKKVFNDVEGVPAGLIGLFVDISERKASETALQESEARFRLLVENAADAFYLFNREGWVLDVNRHACLDLGYSRDELLMKRIDQISVDYQQVDFARSLDYLVKVHQATIEDTFRCKDGSTFPAEVRICHVERDGDLFIALARDISERKQGEQVLRNALFEARAARDQVDNILRSVADGVIVVDERKRITVINHVAAELLDVDAARLVGAPFTRLFPTPELRAQAEQFLHLPQHDVAEFDLRLTRAEGQFPRVVEARTSWLYRDDATPAGQVTLLHDVSREREIDRIKSEFISTAAHELRTPLAVVLGYCELLLGNKEFGDFDGGQKKQFLHEIYKKGQSLTRIVDDLFDISRIEAGLPLPLDLSACQLDAIVTEVLDRFAGASPGHLFESRMGCAEPLYGDAGKLTQVFENLISNAVKYSPGGGTIMVETALDGPLCTVKIADHGIGMSSEQLERVFDKFYRADSSNTAIGGLGIGMSIVRAIIETHGGEISVDSTLGEGTTVRLTLPLRHVSEPQEQGGITSTH